MARREKVNCVLVATMALLLMTHSISPSEAKRSWSSSNNRKTGGGTSRNPSSSNTGHVTKPTYSGSSSGNSHADVAKLSYPNYNSQPNRPAAAGSSSGQNAAPIGWNVPKQQGPPPAYSASNPAGGAKTNMHEPPPVYRAPSNSAPPSYGASNAYGSYPGQGVPAGATYHAPGALPAGATYYPSAGHVPAGATYHSPGSMPAGATYYPGGGHYPAAGGYPAGGAYPAGGVPAGATYLPAGAALPAGATYYSQPPQSSSGLGFGSGLAAGAIGGAILGHVLTPTQTRVVESAPAGNSGSGGEDKVIIINNGPPGAVQATSAGAGTTVINTGGVPMNTTTNGETPAAGVAGQAPAPAPAAGSDPAIPSVPLAPMGDTAAANGAAANPPPPPPAAAPAGEQPPAGGIICVPVRVNETDPADSSKMVEVEKVACYPAPPPPPPAAVAGAENNGTAAVMSAADSNVPLAPMAGGNSQQLQQSPTQSPLLPENSSMRAAGNTGAKHAPHYFFAPLFSILLLALMGLRQ